MNKIYLPIEPNLILLQQLFIFDYSTYTKILIDDFELRKNKYQNPLLTCLDVFEKNDCLEFYSANIGYNKETLYTRYIYYKSSTHYFIAKLNNVKSIFDFIGVTERYLKMYHLKPYEKQTTKKIYELWKTELKKPAGRKLTKKQKLELLSKLSF